MYFVLNPFKKHEQSEFPGVLIPLSQAQHRRTSITGHNPIATEPEKTGSEKADAEKDESDKKSDRGSVNSSEPGLTLESLKAEIEADIAEGEHDSAYDRKLLRQPSTGLG